MQKTWLEKDESGDISPYSEAPLDSLIKKVRSLTLRNHELEGELQLAKKKLAFYESFDESIQQTMAQSLRLAFEIKAKSEQEARELLEDARRDERLLRGEVAKLAAERQAMLAEREALQNSVEETRSRLEREGSRQAGRTSERARLVAEVAALEDRLQSIRQELAPSPSVGLGKAGSQDLGPVITTPAASVPVDFPISVVPAAHERVPAPDDSFGLSAAMQNPIPSVEELKLSPPSGRSDFFAAAFQTSVLPIEDEKLLGGTGASTYPVAPRTSVLGIENEKPSIRAGLAGSSCIETDVQAEGEVELVVSPVHSFPKLVEFERALQTLAEVKSLYVRDFRYGVATLLLKLISPERREILPSKLEGLPGWNLVILSCPPNRIEAKIGA